MYSGVARMGNEMDDASEEIPTGMTRAQRVGVSRQRGKRDQRNEFSLTCRKNRDRERIKIGVGGEGSVTSGVALL